MPGLDGFTGIRSAGRFTPYRGLPTPTEGPAGWEVWPSLLQVVYHSGPGVLWAREPPAPT